MNTVYKAPSEEFEHDYFTTVNALDYYIYGNKNRIE